MPIPTILSTRNGAGSVNGYRDDLVAGDLVGLSLSNYVGITSVKWELTGRPEGSTAGGAGPEPILLATANSTAFNVDSDSGDFRLDGTYTVQATLNPGTPGQIRITVILCRLSGLTIPGPGSAIRTLRKLGGFEALEDTSVPTILLGWATELNRWLELLRETVTGGAGGFTTLAGAYSHGADSSDQTMVLHDSLGGGIVVDGSQSNFTGASALRINTAAGSPVVVDRATGRVGIGIAAPLQQVHIFGSAPAVRLDRSGGAALDVMNVGDELQFLNGALVMAKMEPTGGLRADLGVGIGVAPATGAVLALGPASTVPVSSASTARFRYNEVTGHAEWSENGGAYQPFGAALTGAYNTIDANGTPLTQRTILNFSARLTAVDNSGATRTDVDLATTAVTPGSYVSTNLTVDAFGRITAASSGGAGTVTSVTGNAPIQSSGGTTPAISLLFDAASITLNGSNQIQRAALTGAITAAAGSNVTVLANAGAGAGIYGGSGVSSITLDAQGRVTAVTTATYLTSAFYQTVAAAGSPLTQRGTLNFGAEFTAADNSGAARTDVNLATQGGLGGGGTFDRVTVNAVGVVTAGTVYAFTPGSLLFANSSGLIGQDNAEIFWDDTNFRLGVGTATPLYQAHFRSQSTDADFAARGLTETVYNGATTSSPLHRLQTYAGTAASPAIVLNTSYLGTFTYEAYDGAQLRDVVQVGTHATNGATMAAGSLPSTYYVAMDPRGLSNPFTAGNPLPWQMQVSPTSARGFVSAVAIGAPPGVSLGTSTALLVIGNGASGQGHNARIALINTTVGPDQGSQFTLGNDAGTGTLTYTSSTFAGPEGADAMVFSSGSTGGAIWFEPGNSTLRTVSIPGPAVLGSIFSGRLDVHQPNSTSPVSGLSQFVLWTDGDTQAGTIYQTSTAWAGAEGTSSFNFNNGAGKIHLSTSTPSSANTLSIGYTPGSVPNVVQGGDTATNATHGFMYIGSSAGAPTGTPTSESNALPVTIDRTNNTFNFYSSGAWRTLSASVFYQTVAATGSPLTQRTILNFDGTVVATDSVSPARTNVGLPAVGPGAGTIGGAGISSITLDAQGRVTGATTGTFGTGGYTTFEANGTPVTARAIANFSPDFGVADNSGATRTDVSLANAGAGAGAYGGSGISGITLDAKGRVTVVGTATYLTSTGASGGTFNNITFNGSGLVLGGSNVAYLTSAFYQTVEASGTPLTQRGILNFNGTVVAVDNAGSARTDIGLPNVGPGAGLAGGSGISGFVLDAQGRVVSVNGATYLTSAYVTAEANGSALTQRNALNFGPGLTAVDSASPARTNVDLSATGITGTFGGSGQVIELLSFDSYGRVTGILAVTPTPAPTSAILVYNFSLASFTSGSFVLFAGATQPYGVGVGPYQMSLSGATGISTCEYPLGIVATQVTIRAWIVRNDLVGASTNITFGLTRNNVFITSSSITVVAGAGSQFLSTSYTIAGGSDFDTYGLYMDSSLTTGGALTGTITMEVAAV